MRLAVPSVKMVRDQVTGAELSYVGGSANRDMLGSIYRMTCFHADRLLAVEVIAGNMTYSPADRYAKSIGIDCSTLGVSEHRRFIEKYANDYGAMFDVSKFHADQYIDKLGMIVLRDQFLQLFFERNSSYLYNRAGEIRGGGYYPDKVQFYPYGLDRKLCGVFDNDAGVCR
jgi:hypothetical protein